MRYWPLLAGYLLLASQAGLAAEGDPAAPTAEPSGDGTEAPAPDGGGSGESDPGCD